MRMTRKEGLVLVFVVDEEDDRNPHPVVPSQRKELHILIKLQNFQRTNY